MASKWVVDAEHPQGHLVPLTLEEEAQLAADLAAWEGESQQQQTRRGNARSMQDALRQRMQEALDLASKIEDGTATAAEQRQGLALCLRGLVRLTRLELDAFEVTT